MTKHLSAVIALPLDTRIATANNPSYAAPTAEEITQRIAFNAQLIHQQDIPYYFPKQITQCKKRANYLNLILMNCNEFKILRANLRKSKDISQSLLNDNTLESYSAILITEPWAKLNGSIPFTSPFTYMHWQPFFPSRSYTSEKHSSAPAFRAMIWINKAHIYSLRRVAKSSRRECPGTPALPGPCLCTGPSTTHAIIPRVIRRAG